MKVAGAPGTPSGSGSAEPFASSSLYDPPPLDRQGPPHEPAAGGQAGGPGTDEPPFMWVVEPGQADVARSSFEAGQAGQEGPGGAEADLAVLMTAARPGTETAAEPSWAPEFGSEPMGGTPGGPGTSAMPAVPDAIGHDDAPREPRGAAPRGRGPLKIIAVTAGVAVVLGGGAVAAMALTGGSDGDGTAAIANRPVADAPKVNLQAMEAQRRKENLDKASEDAQNESDDPFKLRPKGTPPPTKTPSPGGGGGGGGVIPPSDPVPAGVAQAYAKSMLPTYFGSTGRQKGQFACLVNLWNKESGWRTNAGNPSSGAYGIPQALPGPKMASEGPDWRTNHKTQIRWGLKYIKGRYSTPCGAWNHFLANNWY